MNRTFDMVLHCRAAAAGEAQADGLHIELDAKSEQVMAVGVAVVQAIEAANRRQYPACKGLYLSVPEQLRMVGLAVRGRETYPALLAADVLEAVARAMEGG